MDEGSTFSRTSKEVGTLPAAASRSNGDSHSRRSCLLHANDSQWLVIVPFFISDYVRFFYSSSIARSSALAALSAYPTLFTIAFTRVLLRPALTPQILLQATTEGLHKYISCITVVRNRTFKDLDHYNRCATNVHGKETQPQSQRWTRPIKHPTPKRRPTTRAQ